MILPQPYCTMAAAKRIKVTSAKSKQPIASQMTATIVLVCNAPMGVERVKSVGCGVRVTFAKRHD